MAADDDISEFGLDIKTTSDAKPVNVCEYFVFGNDVKQNGATMGGHE
jgi:hypothetical protein